MIGKSVAHYKIVSKLGEGGMGEVYEATDTKLKRHVALKILPEHFASDSQRMGRFQREAEVLASLSHPNIGHIYGIENAGATKALVLELIEGPTLADRLAQGAIPVDEALSIALQIAEALEAAHEKGIIHRDLKPANIKLTPDGQVKVLDFGLAKALQTETTSSTELTQSPTLTAAATQAGIVLGTAAYMSPEQARGRSVDLRSDIWSFGAVLFEMLTARRAFQGEDVAETLAAVLKSEPDWDLLASDVSHSVRKTISRCLTRDLRQRLQAIGDARIEIEGWEAEQELWQPGGQGASRWLQPRLVVAAIAAAFLLGASVAPWLLSRLAPSAPDGAQDPKGPSMSAVIELPAAAPLALGSNVPLHGFDSPGVALSPDGARLAYVGQSDSEAQLYLREMSEAEVKAVAGTEGAIHPFFSPDGQWIGFLTNTQVKKVAVQSGTVSTLTDATAPVQAWWRDGDLIYFSHSQGNRLSRVPADGSQRPTPLIDEPLEGLVGNTRMAKFSDVLPDGKTVLVTKWTDSISADYAEVLALKLDTLNQKALLHSGYGARYVLPGHLVFGRSGNLMAVRFDPESLEVESEPTPVGAGAAMESLFGQVHAAASDNGLLAFAPGGDRTLGKLAWVDRNGEVEFLEDVPARVYGAVNLSPDGNRLAVHVADVTDYIWIYDVERRFGKRLSGSESHGWPIWSPDGRRIKFDALMPERVLVRSVDSGDTPQEVISGGMGGGWWRASSWSPDGKLLALGNSDTGNLSFVSMQGERQVTDVPGMFPDFSPDGQWFAYTSQDGYAIWVASYPDGAIRRQISDAGIETVWCPNGELFYRNGNRWYSTRITTGADLRFDPPTLVFETDFIDTPGISFDVSPDGQRLLVVKRAAPEAKTKLQVITNWPRKLKTPTSN